MPPKQSHKPPQPRRQRTADKRGPTGVRGIGASTTPFVLCAMGFPVSDRQGG